MELRTLTYVEAVARLGGFTAAARELHVAQPAVSSQVAQAERELGVALFVRAHHRTTPTEAGEIVVEHARRIQSAMAELRADVDGLRGLLRGTLRIGATPLLGEIDLPGLAAEVQRRHRQISVHITTGLIDVLLDQLRTGDLDMVFGPIRPDAEGRFVTRVLHREEVVLITPPGSHPGSPESMASEPFVCLPADSGLRRILERAGERWGFTPRVRVEVTSPHQIREFVSAGVGVAVVAASVATKAGPPVEVIRLDPALTHPPLGVIIRQGEPDRAVREMLALTVQRHPGQ